MRKLLIHALVFASLGILPARAQHEPPAPSLTAIIPNYPDNPGGLKKLFQDILKSQKEPDPAKVDAYLRNFILPNADDWFGRVFGQELGPLFADAYKTTHATALFEMSSLFPELLREKMTDITTHRFEGTCDPEADEHQYPVLAARQQSEPLFGVRAFHVNYGKVLWFFAYVDGAFRWIGPLSIPLNAPLAKIHKATTSAASGDQKPPKRLRVGGAFQRAQLLRQVPPQYPENARRAGLQGTVRLSAIIGTDGAIENLQVLQGRCWLAEAAVKAVRNWRYKPTLLEDKPVEVITTIDVSFALGR